MNPESLPVAVIGAGPVGLAAASQLIRRGLEPIIFERGSEPGASIRAWGHVRVFSPWRYNIDEAARALLSESGWSEPDLDAYPTGDQIVDQYLASLARHPRIKRALKLDSRVVSVSRLGFDKLKSSGREYAPFVLRVERSDGRLEEHLAAAVIDASGTWTQPNPLGAAGVEAIGEPAARDRISYGIPDVLGRERERFAGRRVLVVGSGDSAFNALIDLATLAGDEPETRVFWAVRRPADGLRFGGGAADMLPERGALGAAVQHLASQGAIEVFAGFRTARVQRSGERVIVASQDRELPPVDEVIVATGFRPELAMLRELRLALDPAVESPIALAPLIDPNVHSCGTVPPHGVDELSHPEPGFYIAGVKSYGRAPTFLMLTGYEQVRSIASALAGDWEAARDVQLVLPETGVCSVDLGPQTNASACCGSQPEVGDLVLASVVS